MVAIFREVWRVMRDDGTLWLNMGDCYAASQYGSGGTNNDYADKLRIKGVENYKAFEPRKLQHGLKPKDLVGMPWRLALALQADGWYLRSDIIWSKPNPMPESCTDRPTKAHEYVFLMAKQQKYYYDADAVREAHSRNWLDSGGNISGTGTHKLCGKYVDITDRKPAQMNPHGRNRRTVWSIPTHPYSEAHFATFPTKLVIPCIKAGTSEKGNCSVCGKPWVRVVDRERTFESGSGRSGNPITGKQPAVQGTGYGDVRLGPTITSKTIGWQPSCTCNADTVKPIVLDPFMGSGTVAEVCEQYGRSWIGIELSQEYCDIAVKRIEKEAKQMKMLF